MYAVFFFSEKQSSKNIKNLYMSLIVSIKKIFVILRSMMLPHTYILYYGKKMRVKKKIDYKLWYILVFLFCPYYIIIISYQ